MANCLKESIWAAIYFLKYPYIYYIYEWLFLGFASILYVVLVYCSLVGHSFHSHGNQVGTISANGEHDIGELLARAMEKVGKEGVITVAVSSFVLDLWIY